MKSQYVNGLAEGVHVDSSFVLRSKEMRATRSGEAYLSLELGDRSGSIPGVWFRPGTAAAACPAGSVVRVSGVVTTFRGARRISVDAMSPARSHDPADMVDSGGVDRERAAEQFKAMAARVSSTELRAVLRAVFGDRIFFERFAECPGSQASHHAHLGGLMLHSTSVAGICIDLAERYSQVERDLLLTAALLHDIGKVDELSWGTGIEYTDEGRLVGHVVLGERRLRRAVDGMRSTVRAPLMARLSHAMLAHHGEFEWGSPKRPSTIEALLLHHADNLDAKAAGFIDLTSRASVLDERWTDAQNLFRRPLYAPSPMEDDRPSRATEDESYLRVPA